jgi:phospholipase C
MNRREFLRTAGLVGGAALVGGPTLLRSPGLSSLAHAVSATTAAPPFIPADSVLNSPASECPIDTIVVLMMENRSFDHYFGHFASDEQYMEEGRRRHGREFSIEGRTDVMYTDGSGKKVQTHPVRNLHNEINTSRGCMHKDPGHGWGASRVQRDKGFLAEGSGNDNFAISYYLPDELPVQGNLARRFTVMDHYHSSVLGPTWPNREYLYAATSEGMKKPPKPLDWGVWKAPNIFDRLKSAGVSVKEFFVNIPPAALWGRRMTEYIESMDVFFARASEGTLPNVCFLTPGMGNPARTDDHPHGDFGIGQRFMQAVFSAFVRSPHWQRGMFMLTYDEHGGFFDHVKPPVVKDDRASSDDGNNFGQLGFRVPTALASPYAPANYVDHNLYDHTSILRFLEWRFLGAPPQGPGKKGDRWFLTKRDRHTNNFGASLRSGNPDPVVDLETPAATIPLGTPDCEHAKRLEETGKDETNKVFDVSDQLDAIIQQRSANFTPWLRSTDIRDLPPNAVEKPG